MNEVLETKAMKILVVDDVPSARKVLVRMLNSLGFKDLVEVSSVTEALDAISSKPIELIISDVHLKDGMGTDILSKLQEAGERIAPFIFVTSDMEKETAVKAINLGAGSYLLKPFSPANLELKIKECFKGNEASN